jgi:hypothetical protein
MQSSAQDNANAAGPTEREMIEQVYGELREAGWDADAAYELALLHCAAEWRAQ